MRRRTPEERIAKRIERATFENMRRAAVAAMLAKSKKRRKKERA